MPIKNARYRWKTYPSGKKVRLAFVNGNVVEVKKPGEPAEMVQHPHKHMAMHGKMPKGM